MSELRSRPSFRDRLAHDVAELTGKLKEDPDQLLELWTAKLYLRLIEEPSSGLAEAAGRCDELRQRLGDHEFRDRLLKEVVAGLFDLVGLWNAATEGEADARAHEHIAEWIIDLCHLEPNRSSGAQMLGCWIEEMLEQLGDDVARLGARALAERFYAASHYLAPEARATAWDASVTSDHRVGGPLLDRLNHVNLGRITFSFADQTVVRGESAFPGEGTVRHGAPGVWGSWAETFGPPYPARPGELVTGVTIREGEVEKLRRGELRCYRTEGEVRLGYFLRGKLASLELRYAPRSIRRADRPFELGLFTLFGPQVSVASSFSSSGPTVCEVVTVDQLVDLAAPARRPRPDEDLEFEKQLGKTLAVLDKALKKQPDDLRGWWTAKLYLGLTRNPGPRLQQAAARFDEAFLKDGGHALRQRLLELGSVPHLADLWNGLHESGFGGRAYPHLAEWLVALCPDEEQLEALGDSAESYGEADLAVRFYAAARRAAGDAGIEQPGAALALWPRVDRGLLDRLNAANKESVRFSLADKAVARGRRSLAGEASEGATVYHGKRGKWGTWSEFFGRPYQAKRGELRTGVRVAPGDVWKLPRGELRCYRVGPEVRFGYFKDDHLASVELRCVPPPDAADASVDVGWFTLFGSRVFVGTPFSDNDPDNCEIVTVDQLRDLGGGPAIPPPPLAGA